jgi:hypothetical protein
MYKLKISHICKNCFARGHIYVSVTLRGGCSLSSSGVRFPNLVLKSPHTTDVCCGCIYSRTSCTCAVAWASVMSRRVRDEVGGKYTFVTFMRWLVGRTNLVYRPYSFPYVVSSCID